MKLGSQIGAWLGAPEVWPNAASGSLKKLAAGTLEWFGGIGEFCVRLVEGAVTPPYEGRELLRQMDEIGAKSLPLVALAGSAIGVVLSLHTRDSLSRFGAKSMLPALIILSLVKETGPIITALVVSGRVGGCGYRSGTGLNEGHRADRRHRSRPRRAAQ